MASSVLVQGDDPFPSPAGHTTSDTGQEYKMKPLNCNKICETLPCRKDYYIAREYSHQKAGQAKKSESIMKNNYL